MNTKRSIEGLSRRGRAVAFALVASVLAACSSTRGTAQNTYVSEDGAAVEETIGNFTLSRELVMESVRTERRDGRLFVQFNLRNTRASSLPAEWTLVWFDEAGFKLDHAHHWTPIVLDGKGFETISQTAPTPAASGFRLALRKPTS